MEVIVELNNLAKSPVRKPFFERVILETLEEVKYGLLKKKNVSVSVALVSGKEIKKINRIYRKKDKATDVLSFGEFKNFDEIKGYRGQGLFLGELILCYDDIRKYAKKEGIVLSKELKKVIAHGVLHLLGFRHGKEMFFIQDKIANSPC